MRALGRRRGEVGERLQYRNSRSGRASSDRHVAPSAGPEDTDGSTAHQRRPPGDTISPSVAFLGLGSNLGDRCAWLRAGLTGLRQEGLELDEVSSAWLTEPVGDPGLPWFVNCAARVIGPPEPEELLRTCALVERSCGRERGGERLSPRTLDIDVLLYDQRVIDTDTLRVPHPSMHLRRFVLQPLAEIAPDAVHPGSGRAVSDLLGSLAAGECVWLLARAPA